MRGGRRHTSTCEMCIRDSEGTCGIPVYRNGEHEFSYISRKDRQLRKVTVSGGLEALPPGYEAGQAERHGDLYVFGTEPPILETPPGQSKAAQRKGRER